MTLSDFLRHHLRYGAILVRIMDAQGSTPREAGAEMVVAATETAGTIGGGQLEFHCIDFARRMLETGADDQLLDIPLGPQMGQCCGGRVGVRLQRVDKAALAMLAASEQAQICARHRVMIFGAGHTGRALTLALAPLPFATTLIDDRDQVLNGMPAAITCIRMADPVLAVERAISGTAFVILSHSHALDYRLAEAALARGDAAYVGMIGSGTKRARFEASFLRSGGREAALERLTCPIGGSDVDDKRPEVIAALTAAELVRSLLGVRRTEEKTGRERRARETISE